MDDEENLCLPADFLDVMRDADELSLSGSLPDDMDDEDDLPLAMAFPDVIDDADALPLPIPINNNRAGNLVLPLPGPFHNVRVENLALPFREPYNNARVENLVLPRREAINNARNIPEAVNLPDSMDEAENLAPPVSRPPVNDPDSLTLSVAIPDSTVDEDDLPLSVVFHDGMVDDDDRSVVINEDMDDADDMSSDGSDGSDDDSSSSDVYSVALNHADNLSLSEAVPQAVNTVENFMKNVNKCLLPKLSNNYDERDPESEYDTRNKNLKDNVRAVIKGLEEMDIKNTSDNAEMTREERIMVLATLLNLYKEMMCECSWNTAVTKDCARRINEVFQRKCGFKIEDLLKRNELCESQNVYDRFLDDMCKKLNVQDFKKYPGQVEVYCDFMKYIRNYDVRVNPVKVLPVSLILLDDYIELNKVRGLLCCQSLLKAVTPKHFDNGNFYDVIYISLRSALANKVIRITELCQACILELCRLFPLMVKEARLEDMYCDALEQIYTECNLYRKAAFFRYTREILSMLQIRGAGKTLFKTVVCDSIDSCMSEAVADILLIPTLECLEEWIKYCWPVWKLSVDFKVLCTLLKYYTKCNTGEAGLLTQQLIATLVTLCTPEEQKVFMTKLGESQVVEKPKIEKLRKDVGTQS